MTFGARTRHLSNVWGLSWQQLGGSVLLAWQQLETKATIVREWSEVLHAGVGGQGKLPFCTAAVQAVWGVNLINCFQAVSVYPSINCVVDEHLLSMFTLIFVLEQEHGPGTGIKCTVNCKFRNPSSVQTYTNRQEKKIM